MFQRHNLVTCLLVAAIAAASAACVLLASRYPIPCTIGGIFVSSFAAQLDLPKPPVALPTIMPEPPAP